MGQESRKRRIERQELFRFLVKPVVITGVLCFYSSWLFRCHLRERKRLSDNPFSFDPYPDSPLDGNLNYTCSRSFECPVPCLLPKPRSSHLFYSASLFKYPFYSCPPFIRALVRTPRLKNNSGVSARYLLWAMPLQRNHFEVNTSLSVFAFEWKTRQGRFPKVDSCFLIRRYMKHRRSWCFFSRLRFSRKNSKDDWRSDLLKMTYNFDEENAFICDCNSETVMVPSH